MFLFKFFSTAWRQPSCLEFKIDFDALSEVRFLFQANDFLQALISAAELFRDVDRRLQQVFYPQLRASGSYPFSAADEHECSRTPYYAFYEDEELSAVARSSCSIAEVKGNLSDRGFTTGESDTILYLVLQTCCGIPNILCGSVIRACHTLIDVEELGLSQLRVGKRVLQVAHDAQGLINIFLRDEQQVIRDENGDSRPVVSCSAQLQVSSKLLVKQLSFSVKDEALARCVYQRLRAYKFNGQFDDSTVVFDLHREMVAALVRNSDDTAAKTFMRLVRIFSLPERSQYQSNSAPDRKGEWWLCLNVIDLCVRCNYEFELLLFALDKLLNLCEQNGLKFTRDVVTPRVFCLPHFVDDVVAVVRSHREQFVIYISSLEHDDITGDNLNAIAAIMANLALFDFVVVLRVMLLFLRAIPDLIDQFLLQLRNNFQERSELQTCLGSWCKTYASDDTYKDLVQELAKRSCALGLVDSSSGDLSILLMATVSKEDIELVAAKHEWQVKLREDLIQEILGYARAVIPLADAGIQDVQLEWNNAMIEHLERELRNRLREHVGISRLFLRLRVHPYRVSLAACEELIDVILKKISLFRDSSSSFTLLRPLSISAGPR